MTCRHVPAWPAPIQPAGRGQSIASVHAWTIRYTWASPENTQPSRQVRHAVKAAENGSRPRQCLTERVGTSQIRTHSGNELHASTEADIPSLVVEAAVTSGVLRHSPAIGILATARSLGNMLQSHGFP